jgi:phosphate transport system permease protein
MSPDRSTDARSVSAPPQRPVARSTLLIDRAMHHLIKVGGVGIIAAIFAIFVFIFLQVLPLFQGARVTLLRMVAAPPGNYVALGADEWMAKPFLLAADGTFTFLALDETGVVEIRRPALPDDPVITAVRYRALAGVAPIGTADGRFSVVTVKYEARLTSAGRAVEVALEPGPLTPIGPAGAPVRTIDYADAGAEKLAAALVEVDGRIEVHAVRMTQKRSLTGAGRTVVEGGADLTPHIQGRPVEARVNGRADSVLVRTEEGEVFYLHRIGGEFALRQRFRPLADDPVDVLVGLDFLLGDESVVCTGSGGRQEVYSLFGRGQEGIRQFSRTKTFPSLPAGDYAFSPSLRNKAFLVAGPGRASLRYGTSERVRWEEPLPFVTRLARLGSKYDHFLLFDAEARLHVYGLRDPHPEAGWRAFFGRVWYEGSARPKFEWQSTGSTDEFEPKLSMVPLIVGTLKGTFYALVFAVPLALLAAMYTAQFAHPRYRKFIKPVMEIMASLPSVILGFLAALWLAPLLETRVPSLLGAAALVLAAAAGMGALWEALPGRLRGIARPGHEFLLFIPVLLLAGQAGWSLGPALEQWLFVTRHPVTGEAVADFRLWWPQATGAAFEQRNSLVVGFMMGFAVIPIIFTIAEDAFSNVPPAFRSASLALGASRWQTAMRVVLPTASAGVFSAVMIGLGRAVGETMIVLMATGNTPIMDFNIFSGMRTLSANIAVELPEAPLHSTLYRSLFLGALLLFLMTFFVNTLAELLRHHLREKFKAV